MSPPTETLQRIRRLAPLAEIRALIADVAPVAPRTVETAVGTGAVLAEDAPSAKAAPAAPRALKDGWAVAAEQVLDAGPFAPVPLSPPPAWVETGESMPAGTDAILPVDAVTLSATGAEAQTSATAGDGVALVGNDAAAGAVVRRAGERLRPSDAAVLHALGIRFVSVRAPRVTIFSVTVPTRSRNDTISPIVARAVESAGGIAQVAQASTLESALSDRACDLVIAIGGTGTGKRDAAVKTLARVGKVELHGFGIAPGETAAFGSAFGKPVLLLPGQLDAALAVLLVVGRALLTRLAGATEEPRGASLPLTRKVTSTVGIADMVLARHTADGAEPLGTGAFPLQTIAAADGWFLVPPESEGFAASAAIELMPLP